MELAHVPDRTLAKIALTAAVLAAGVGLAASSHRVTHCGGRSYFFADDLVATGLRSQQGRELRVHGFVQAGTIDHSMNGDETDHHFMLVHDGVGVRVHVRGPLPDTFRDHSEVIVFGHLVNRDGWSLEGTAVIAKCPTKYEGPPNQLESVFK